MSPHRTLIVAAIISVGLISCGSDGDPNNSDSGFGPLAVVDGPPSGNDALIQGTLSVDGECVTLIQGAEHVLIAWPSEGTIWDADTRTIRYDDGESGDDEPRIVEMADGDTVKFSGGGFSEIESGDDYDEVVASIDWLQEPGKDCATSTIWFAG